MHDVLRRALVARVGDVLPGPTPLERAALLSARLERTLLLKREDMTPVFSFKLRGAYNRICQLEPAERAAGVITASAGNHAQGVAFSAHRLSIPCRIVMPQTTPGIKVDAVRRFGVDVVLFGDSYSDAAAHCSALAEESGATIVPPFDDLDVIAGQATIALELLHQAPRDLGCIFVPVGGGGLASGIASIMKELRPAVRIIGVEPSDSDAMRRSLLAGERVELDHVGIFADGVAVKKVGKFTYDLCSRYLDDCIAVSTDEICAAIKDAYLDTRTVLEGAGALAIAGAKRLAESGELPEGAVVAIASGANIPFTKLGYVSERAEMGEHREAIFAVTIPEVPGAFFDFCRVVGNRSVTEFNYRLGSRDRAHIFLGVEVAGRLAAAELQRRFSDAGYACTDLSNDDIAKMHVRHMVGGRAVEARDEVLYAFEFPERPGALSQFLASLGNRWNISLFHYRNHGSAFGRVLCGLEVPKGERAALSKVLDALGFEYEDVTESPAARFLRNED